MQTDSICRRIRELCITVTKPEHAIAGSSYFETPPENKAFWQWYMAHLDALTLLLKISMRLELGSEIDKLFGVPCTHAAVFRVVHVPSSAGKRIPSSEFKIKRVSIHIRSPETASGPSTNNRNIWASLDSLAKANVLHHEQEKQKNPLFIGSFPTMVELEPQGHAYHYLHDIERFLSPTTVPLSEGIRTALNDVQRLCMVAINQGSCLRFSKDPKQVVPDGGRMVRGDKGEMGWKKDDRWNWRQVLNDPTCELKTGCSPLELFTLYAQL